MNKARRKAIRGISEQLEILYERLVQIRDEEQECLDNLPESLQGGERAAAMSNLDSESFLLGRVTTYMLRNWQ